MDRLCVLQLTGILDGGDTSAKVGTRYGPASLGDPDPLAGGDTVDSIAGVLDRLPEDVCGVADGGVLEVGVAGKRVSVKVRLFVFFSKKLTRPCR